METQLPFKITRQPDDDTCGPSCLHAIYRYYGDVLPLREVIDQVPMMAGGGTLAVQLGLHALSRGYQVTLYTYNLHVFDPTWFRQSDPVHMVAKLRSQAQIKQDPKLQFATPAYIAFLEAGGCLRFEDLTAALIRKYLSRHVPIISGLSSTYLYQSAREIDNGAVVEDDVRGYSSGHFVVLCGYDREAKEALIADPYARNPVAGDRQYKVSINRVLIAILLGVITYDANLLIIRPRHKTGGEYRC